MSIELLTILLTNFFTILTAGVALWMGGWRALRGLRQDIDKRFEQVDKRFEQVERRLESGQEKLADGLADVRVEVAEVRARLDGRTLPVPPAPRQG